MTRDDFPTEEAYVWWLVEDTRRMRDTLAFRLARLRAAVQRMTDALLT